MKKLTPAQQQYADMKKQHPDCVLLFRLGDFYELFHEDAHIAHKVLGITLTARDKNADEPIPMAWIPHHALEKYLPKFLEAGYKVALADQVGEVIPWKLVERQITQIYTPWTWIEQWSKTSYMVAIAQYDTHRACAWWDPTLWEWTTWVFSTREEIVTHLQTLSPRELLCSSSLNEKSYFEQVMNQQFSWCVSYTTIDGLSPARLMQLLWVSSFSWFGKAVDESVINALFILFSYLQWLKQPIFVRRIDTRREKNHFFLDHLTVKNLEIFEWSYQWTKKHTLYSVLNTCVTSMWSRLLASRLLYPTQDIAMIRASHEAIARWSVVSNEAKMIREVLKWFGDIPRIAQTITQKKRFIVTLYALTQQISEAHRSEYFVHEIKKYNQQLFEKIDMFFTTTAWLFRDTISDEDDWYAEWKNQEVDRLRQISWLTDDLLLQYQQSLIDLFGVPLKVKHLSNQWYVFEVTPKDVQRFETLLNDWNYDIVRAQTLKTGQRYTSSYLLELQQKIYSAEEELVTYQKNLAEDLFTEWQKHCSLVYEYVDAVALLDLNTSMWLFMVHHDRTIPEMNSGHDLRIIAWRHPVVETFLPHEEQFIPNTLECTSDSFFHIITWPNMWWKSTYMRQNALILLLAHAWFPVPAKQATICIIDWIFARIWTGDIIAKQQSTFMTEMLETAAILNNASKQSFIIIDELGRWTSTSDWLALAKAISVYICQNIKAKTLFATHFHELIDLEWTIPWIQNWHVEVYETDNEVVFLKKIWYWWADKSYGLDVAQLAWIPLPIVSLARQYVLEHTANEHKSLWIKQHSLFNDQSKNDILMQELKVLYWSLDVTSITPLDALLILDKIVTSIRDSNEM
jgi:DNA mismatch repair protein MutS